MLTVEHFQDLKEDTSLRAKAGEGVLPGGIDPELHEAIVALASIELAILELGGYQNLFESERTAYRDQLLLVEQMRSDLGLPELGPLEVTPGTEE